MDDADNCRNLYRFIRCRMGPEPSDRELANRWGMPWRSFTLLKSGNRGVPAIARLRTLAEVLRVDATVVYAVAGGADAERVHGLLLAADTDQLARLLMPGVNGRPEHGPADLYELRIGRLPDVVLALDVDRHILRFNERLCQWTQRDRNDLQGRMLDELLVPEQRGRVQEQLAVAYREGTVDGVPITLEAVDGTTRAVEMWAHCIGDRTSAHGLQASLRDVSRHTEALEAVSREERRLRHLIHTSPDLIHELDLVGTIESANRTFLGEDGRFLVGLDYLELVAQSHRQAVRLAFAEVVRTRQPTEYVSPIDVSGLRRVLRCRVGPMVRDGELCGLVQICTDVTVRHPGSTET